MEELKLRSDQSAKKREECFSQTVFFLLLYVRPAQTKRAE